MLRALLIEVAQNRGAGGSRSTAREILFIVLEAELSRILTDNLDVLPAQPLEALSRDVAEGGGEVDEVDTGEELGDADVGGHGFNVPSRATTNLEGDTLTSWDPREAP